MVKPIGAEERAAWDAYAASVIAGAPAVYLPGDTGDAKRRAEVVAELADAMLVERRKRMSPG